MPLLDYSVADHATSTLVCGIVVTPSSPVRVLDLGASIALRLVSVCLGPSAKPGNRSVLTLKQHGETLMLAGLSAGFTENAKLSVIVQGDCELWVEGTADVHVVARVVTDEEDEQDGEGFEEEEFEEEEEEEEDPNERVKVEILPSDEEAEDDNVVTAEAPPPAKKVKVEESKLVERKADVSKPVHAAVRAKKAEESKLAPANNAEVSRLVQAVPAKKAEETKPAKMEDKKSVETAAESSEVTEEIELEEKPVVALRPAVKPKVPQHDASKMVTPTAVVAAKVVEFIKSELLKKGPTKSMKCTDMGSAISAKFQRSIKKMGFAEKNLSEFLDVHAEGVIKVEGDSVKLME